MWANTLCPFSSSTRNMAFGSGSVTVPSTSIASFFGKLRVILVSGHVRLAHKRDGTASGWKRAASIRGSREDRPPWPRPTPCLKTLVPGFNPPRTRTRSNGVPGSAGTVGCGPPMGSRPARPRERIRRGRPPRRRVRARPRARRSGPCRPWAPGFDLVDHIGVALVEQLQGGARNREDHAVTALLLQVHQGRQAEDVSEQPHRGVVVLEREGEPEPTRLGHRAVSTSCPSSLTAIVCSKWADRDPSSVTTVQPSGRSLVSQPPALTIGSTATTSPGFSTGPRPGDRKSTRLNSSHTVISYAVFCLKKKKKTNIIIMYKKQKIKKTYITHI